MSDSGRAPCVARRRRSIAPAPAYARSRARRATAMAIAISNATSIMSRMCSQASDIAASGSAIADTVPAVTVRVLIGRSTAAWLPSSVCTVAANQSGEFADPGSGRRAVFRTRPSARTGCKFPAKSASWFRWCATPEPAGDVRAFCCCAASIRASTALPAPARHVRPMRRWRDRRCDRRRSLPRRSLRPDKGRRRRAGGRRAEARGACGSLQCLHPKACRTQ